MSEEVERRIWELLERPNVSPYGNPIPGLVAFGADPAQDRGAGMGLHTLGVADSPVTVTVRRIEEPLQTEHHVMSALRRVTAVPGSSITVAASPAGMVLSGGGETIEIPLSVAEHILIEQI